jgi:hypothetical protein
VSPALPRQRLARPNREAANLNQQKVIHAASGGEVDPQRPPTMRKYTPHAVTRLPLALLVASAVCASSGLALPVFGQSAPGQGSPTAGSPAVPATAAAEGTAAQPAVSAVRLDLTRTIVIGASVSDGFGSQALVQVPNPEATRPDAPADAPKAIAKLKPVRLTEALAAVVGSDQPPRHRASAMFFMNADSIAQRQIDAAAEVSSPKPAADKAAGADQPGLVIGIDYLFWHLYGVMPEAERLKTLEKGLSRLDSLKGPVVIGDLPDMRHATLMLRPSQVPTKETLASANTRLAEWAKAKPNVAVVPLTELVLAVMNSKPVSMGGREYTVEQARELMTSDGLHATGAGLIALAQECLVRLKARGLLTSDSTWESDPAKALARIRTSMPTVTPAPADAPAGTIPIPSSGAK